MNCRSSAEGYLLYKFHCLCAMLLAKLDIVYAHPLSIVFPTALVMARMYLHSLMSQKGSVSF